MKRPEYRVVLREKEKLSGELIVSGTIGELVKPVTPKYKKAVIHAYMARKNEKKRHVERLAERIKSPVPRKRIVKYSNPNAQIIPLGIFYVNGDYDEESNFPEADFIFIERAHVVIGLGPVLMFGRPVEGEMYSIKKHTLRALAVYGSAFSSGKVQHEHPPVRWYMRLPLISAKRGKIESLKEQVELAVREGNLEKAIELELRIRDLA